MSISGSLRERSTATYRKNRQISKLKKYNALRRYYRSNRGFNFIEIALALMLFAITIPSVGHIFAVAFKQEAENTNSEQATALASALMDEISERRFRESGAAPGNCTDAGEVSSYDRRGFDDVDDYIMFEKDCGAVAKWGPLTPPRDELGNSLTDYSKFSQNVSVSNIAAPTAGPTARANFDAKTQGTTDYKMVTVKITWNSERDSVQLHKVFAKH